ncbi:MAG: diiron oxygenase [Nocardioidaceae bacterium]|nr:diiron oxygenase [Nocardioidaceae bacterium]MCL2614689.1 diiron oxygenase [Nocardioidaceae bacterium]
MSTTMTSSDTAAYHEMLRTLSEGSVHTNFEAFVDIAWDDPAYAVVPDDERWILPKEFPIGRHSWYQSLPRERQIEIGMAYQAQICKVGLQFESVLIRGVMEYVFTLDNQDPEYRYLMHEVTEETHHTQMFQETVNRTGADVKGARRFLRAMQPVVPVFGRLLPELFFTGVLAGEEPIDHVQKAVLRGGSDIHPMMQRVMQIHVAEEARHISFAHEYLRRTVPSLSRGRRAALSITFPIVMRVLGDAIMKPTPEFCARYDIPKDVVDELYWDSEDGAKMLRDLFADVRTLAEEAGLMNKVSRRLWKALKIDGRPARYRSEPAPAAA